MPEHQSDGDGATVRFPPPFVPIIALAIGPLLEFFVWPLGAPIGGGARWILGALLAVIALSLMAAAIGLFRRTGQDPKPWESTPEIITTGIYAHTRNPMYLGMGLLQGGLGLLLASGWVLVFVPVTWAVIYLIAIRHEEAYLKGKFGSPYLEYMDSVRRWL